MPTFGSLSRSSRRRRRRRGARKGIRSNLIPHPNYPWLQYDPRGVAEVESSRDLGKRSQWAPRPEGSGESGDVGARAIPANGLALS